MPSARPYDPDVKMISGLPSGLAWPARAVRYHGRARTSEFHRSNCAGAHAMMCCVFPELVRWRPETSRARPVYLSLVRAGVIVLQPFLTGIDLYLAKVTSLEVAVGAIGIPDSGRRSPSQSACSPFPKRRV